MNKTQLLCRLKSSSVYTGWPKTKEVKYVSPWWLTVMTITCCFLYKQLRPVLSCITIRLSALFELSWVLSRQTKIKPTNGDKRNLYIGENLSFMRRRWTKNQRVSDLYTFSFNSTAWNTHNRASYCVIFFHVGTCSYWIVPVLLSNIWKNTPESFSLLDFLSL